MLIDVLYFLDKELSALTTGNHLNYHVPSPHLKDTILIVAAVDGFIRLSCSVNSYPKLEIKWSFNTLNTTTYQTTTTKELTKDARITYGKVSDLDFHNLTSSNSGYYYCDTYNTINNKEELFFINNFHMRMKYCLNVIYKPVITTKKRIFSSNLDELFLSCEVNSNPVASLKWHFSVNHTVAHEELDLSMGNEFNRTVLSSAQPRFNGYGTFTCTATNLAGDASESIELIRERKLENYFNITKLSCTG